MNKFALLFLGLCLIFNSFVFADKVADQKAIKETAENYFFGWYEGNSEKIVKAIHTCLAKRFIATLPNNQQFISEINYDAMVAYTSIGSGMKKAQQGWNEKIKIEILAMEDEIASVKITDDIYVDYVHMAKVNGEWKIVNVLWKFKNENK
ncbi:MAG: nuclear transport factor 2 family protein [Acidobacteria bacterium]|nr:nuclear transport factor 2 family protein [Acidobacteriota bacterium]